MTGPGSRSGARLGLRLGAGPGRGLRLQVARHRRPLAVLVALLALWVTIRSAAPPEPASVDVAVAAHALEAGATLEDGDLRIVRWPAAVAPGHPLEPAQAAGTVLATAVGAGEPITATRLLGPGLLAGQPAGSVAITVRVADPAGLAPVRAGDRIDVLAAVSAGDATAEWDDSSGLDLPGSEGTWSGPGAERVAARALVLSRPAAGATSGDEGPAGDWAAGALGSSSGTSLMTSDGSTSGVVVLAVDGATASRLAAAASTRPLSVVLLPS